MGNRSHNGVIPSLGSQKGHKEMQPMQPLSLACKQSEEPHRLHPQLESTKPAAQVLYEAFSWETGLIMDAFTGKMDS